MSDLQKYKIYKITNLDDNRIYVGMTTQSIERRFYHHKQKSLVNTNTTMTRDFNFNNCLLELINEFSTNNYSNARMIERTSIEFVKNNIEKGIVVNKARPIISEIERRKGRWKWRENKGRQKIKCECGAVICKREIARHIKSEKHKCFILGKSSLSSESPCPDKDLDHDC